MLFPVDLPTSPAPSWWHNAQFPLSRCRFPVSRDLYKINKIHTRLRRLFLCIVSAPYAPYSYLVPIRRESMSSCDPGPRTLFEMSQETLWRFMDYWHVGDWQEASVFELPSAVATYDGLGSVWLSSDREYPPAPIGTSFWA